MAIGAKLQTNIATAGDAINIDYRVENNSKSNVGAVRLYLRRIVAIHAKRHNRTYKLDVARFDMPGCDSLKTEDLVHNLQLPSSITLSTMKSACIEVYYMVVVEAHTKCCVTNPKVILPMTIYRPVPPSLAIVAPGNENGIEAPPNYNILKYALRKAIRDDPDCTYFEDEKGSAVLNFEFHRLPFILRPERIGVKNWADVLRELGISRGNPTWVDGFIPSMKARAASLGTFIDFDGDVGNSMESLQLLQWSRQFGLQKAELLADHLAKDQFQKRRCVGVRENLLAAVAAVGLDRELAKSCLERSEYRDKVEAEIASVHDMGVHR
eukprot:UC4_evm4s607